MKIQKIRRDWFPRIAAPVGCLFAILFMLVHDSMIWLLNQELFKLGVIGLFFGVALVTTTILLSEAWASGDKIAPSVASVIVSIWALFMVSLTLMTLSWPV